MCTRGLLSLAYLRHTRAVKNNAPGPITPLRLITNFYFYFDRSSVLAVLHGLRENRNVTEEVAIASRELQAMSELAATLRGTLQEDSAEQLADLVENELLAMDKNIEEAAQMIQVLNN